MATSQPEQRDLRDYIRPVLKRWWLIAAVVPVVTVGTYLYYDSKPKYYTSSTQLFVQSSAVNQILLGGNSSALGVSLENLAVFVQTKIVAERAAKLLEKEKGGRPDGGVSARPLEETNFLAITASSSTPGGAALLANTYAKAFIQTQAEQIRDEARRTLLVAERQLTSLGASAANGAKREALETQIQSLRLLVSQSAGSTGIEVVERAVPSSTPIDQDPASHAIFALVVSLMLAIGGAYLLEYLTRKISSVEDAENTLGLPVLTEVPTVDAPAPFEEGLAVIDRPLHEAFRRLQMNVDMLSHDRPLKSILVVSAAPNEGKSVVTRNLGLAFREAGHNVAVLDADFRKATLGGLLDAQEGPGLTDILAGKTSFGHAVQPVPTPPVQNGNGTHSVYVETQGGTAYSGNPGPGDLAMVPAGARLDNLAATLVSGRMRMTLREATDVYDRVLIDSSPILAAADVLPLLKEVDGVLIVTRLGESTRESAKRMLTELRRVPNLNMVGVVVNGIPPRTYRTRAYGYYYG